MTVLYKKLVDQHLKILEGLQYESGLFAASKKGVGTGYAKACKEADVRPNWRALWPDEG
jgi:hypothetical protein